MKKQQMTKYEKRLIMTNIYYYVLIKFNTPHNRPYSYDRLASEYVQQHLPLYNVHVLIDLTWNWMQMTFNNMHYHIFHLNPSVVINKCKEYGINLDDIKNLQGYIN